ncbi:hypothetical protein ACR8AL_12475 [Clavibacter sepedonicus]|uniref:hypothetical protein n=1 Tax=Clavibacter TaxID=1573 RepID=UPI001CC26B63|nr:MULTISPECIES: hypothetical protein [Clavibacter]UUK64361.1 hypothetical protein LRE50_08590 [Clavibacter sepedonicus]
MHGHDHGAVPVDRLHDDRGEDARGAARLVEPVVAVGRADEDGGGAGRGHVVEGRGADPHRTPRVAHEHCDLRAGLLARLGERDDVGARLDREVGDGARARRAAERVPREHGDVVVLRLLERRVAESARGEHGRVRADEDHEQHGDAAEETAAGADREAEDEGQHQHGGGRGDEAPADGDGVGDEVRLLQAQQLRPGDDEEGGRGDEDDCCSDDPTHDVHHTMAALWESAAAGARRAGAPGTAA